MKTQEGDSCAHAKDRGPGRSQPCPHLNGHTINITAPVAMETKMAPQILGISPFKLITTKHQHAGMFKHR